MRMLQARLRRGTRWDEVRLRDRLQRMVASDHAHPQAVGVVEESGHPKNGTRTASIQRQWCGRTGKVDPPMADVVGAFLDALETLGQTAFSAQAVVMRRCRADGERSRANAPTGVLPASCSGSAGAFDVAVRCSTRTMDRSHLHSLAESE